MNGENILAETDGKVRRCQVMSKCNSSGRAERVLLLIRKNFVLLKKK